MTFVTYFALVLLMLMDVLYNRVRMSNSLPRQTPSVPIYISLIDLLSDMGQNEICNKWLRAKLQKYGALEIWFAGRWNTLITWPDYLSDSPKHEDVYAKAGSQTKIPVRVMASWVGDRLIKSHGQDWKLYTPVMKPGLQKKNFDTTSIVYKSRRIVDLVLKAQSGLPELNGVLVNPLIQRFASATMGESSLDIDFGVNFQASFVFACKAY